MLEGEHDPNNDAEIWSGGAVVSDMLLASGSCVIVRNGQSHKGAICVDVPSKVKKLVCKIKV